MKMSEFLDCPDTATFFRVIDMGGRGASAPEAQAWPSEIEVTDRHTQNGPECAGKGTLRARGQSTTRYKIKPG